MAPESELRQRFESCVDRCADSMFRVAYRLLGNRTLANELVQETYLQAWANVKSLQDPEKMRSWMFSILRNQYSKLIRRESKIRHETASIDSVPQIEKCPTDTQHWVQTAIEELDDKHKLPLLLVSMEGMSTEDAANALGVPKGTVLSRLSRAREKLKTILNRSQPQSR